MVFAVVGVLRGLVAGAGGRPVRVVADGLNRAAEHVVERLGGDVAGVGDDLDPARVVVIVRVHQHRVRARGKRRTGAVAQVRRAVRAIIGDAGQSISKVIIKRLIGGARAG